MEPIHLLTATKDLGRWIQTLGNIDGLFLVLPKIIRFTFFSLVVENYQRSFTHEVFFTVGQSCVNFAKGTAVIRGMASRRFPVLSSQLKSASIHTAQRNKRLSFGAKPFASFPTAYTEWVFCVWKALFVSIVESSDTSLDVRQLWLLTTTRCNLTAGPRHSEQNISQNRDLQRDSQKSLNCPTHHKASLKQNFLFLGTENNQNNKASIPKINFERSCNDSFQPDHQHAQTDQFPRLGFHWKGLMNEQPC